MEVQMQVEDAIALIDDVLQGSVVAATRRGVMQSMCGTGTQTHVECTSSGVQASSAVRSVASQCAPSSVAAATQTDDVKDDAQLLALTCLLQELDMQHGHTCSRVDAALSGLRQRLDGAIEATQRLCAARLQSHSAHVIACVTLLVEEEDRARRALRAHETDCREAVGMQRDIALELLVEGPRSTLRATRSTSHERSDVDATIAALYDDICQTLLT